MCSMAYLGSDALRASFSGFGLSLRCSRLNVGKRWMVKPIGDGAYRYAPGKGWAVVVVVVVDAIRALARVSPASRTAPCAPPSGRGWPMPFGAVAGRVLTCRRSCPIQLPAVGSAEAVGDNRLQTVRDSGGFDPQLYEIQVPASGSPRAAKEVVEALQNASLLVTTDARRGLDHGAWVPLRDLFPAAEVPVAPLSIQHRGGRAGPSPGRARRYTRSRHRNGPSCL